MSPYSSLKEAKQQQYHKISNPPLLPRGKARSTSLHCYQVIHVFELCMLMRMSTAYTVPVIPLMVAKIAIGYSTMRTGH